MSDKVSLISKPYINQNAVEALEEALEKAKTGEVIGVSITWLDKEKSMGGIYSAGENNIMMWAAMEHTCREFYKLFVIEDNDT